MNEIRLPERAEPPEPALAPVPAPVKDPAAGSLALGVALAWGINIIGGAILWGIGSFLLQPLFHGSLVVVGVTGLLPSLVTIGLAIWMIRKGPRRTGIGILIGIASMWAVQLLLIAACFGVIIFVSGR